MINWIYFRSAPPSPNHVTVGSELSIADSFSRETSPSPPISSDQQQDEFPNSTSNQTKPPNTISHTNGVLHYVSSTGNNNLKVINQYFKVEVNS